MSLPRVTVLYSNGNLLADIAAVDGVAGLVGTGKTAGLLGKPLSIFNLADAEGQGITATAEPTAHRHLKEFYSEIGGNQLLYTMLVPDTMTQAQILDNTNESGAKKLTRFAEHRIRLLGTYFSPSAGYDGGDEFIDTDVQAAFLNGKVFGQARLAELAPLRILLEGRVQTPASNVVFSPTTTSNGFCAAVLGGSKPDGSASVGLALGRAVKYGAEIKVGKVANGPLTADQIYIGDKLLKDVLNLEVLHGAGYISFMQHPQKAGFYFGIDRMGSTDDFRFLAFGRVVDKAAVIAAAVYVEELEAEVEVDEAGQIAVADVKYLEGKIVQQIITLMGNQISAVEAYINPAQDIINTSRLILKLRVRPKGYTSFIDIDLGLTAPGVN